VCRGGIVVATSTSSPAISPHIASERSERGWERAEEIQQLLTAAGTHRSAGPVDLLIAATAERERLTILCADHEFETVALITGQPVRLVTDI
jgi:predicted nucleic acid-binding protein